MHEEVSTKSIRFAFTGIRVLTTKVFMRLLKKAIEELKKGKNTLASGKQSVKQLYKHGQGMSTIPVENTDLAGVQQVFRKYGVDFAIRKDRANGRYTIFFKGRDADAITAAFTEYQQKEMLRKNRTSVKERLGKYQETLANLPGRQKEKKKEKGAR